MASDEQKMRQRDALMAQAMSIARQSGTQVGDLPDLRDDRAQETKTQSEARASAAQIAALQSQLAQLRTDYAVSEVSSNVVAGEQYLVFSLLECDCAFKAEHIQGVERLADVTPVPHVVSWVKGVMNLRGSIASVVDLRSFLDMEQLPYSPRTRLLSVQYNEMVICLVVDGVSEMLPIPDAAIINISTRQTYIPQWAFPYAYGSALLDKRAIVLLDAARLLFSDKMQRYAALE